LQANSVTLVADIRTIPRSRHNPQFNIDTFPGALEASRIEYLHAKGLGGLRRPFKDSVNTAWKNDSFRGFADYMESAEFSSSLNELLEVAKNDQVVLICAEAVPWRCHRSLIADALVVRGVLVRHILSETEVREHVLTPWARIEGLKITYPAPQLNLTEGSD
jgi:uncharacterized protein (DUF488 family)